MAARDFSTWVPIEMDSNVTTLATSNAGVYAAAGRVVSMGSNARAIPRLLGADVNGGETFTEDTNSGDTVTLYDYVFQGKSTVSEPQSDDSPADEVAAINKVWLNRFFRRYNAASLGVTGARSSTVSDKRPFTSVYNALTSNDTNAGYTANANLLTSTLLTTGYDHLSTVKGYIENSEFYDGDESLVAFVHPGLLDGLRRVKDLQGRPILSEVNGSGSGSTPAKLLGCTMIPTLGTQICSDFAQGTTGNKLIVFANTEYLARGNRNVPMTRFVPADINVLALQHTVLHFARQSFVLTVPQAASILSVSDL